LLLNAEANVNATSKIDMTPLHLAAGQGRLEVVIVLVDADADVNAIVDRDTTPLSIATSKGHTEIVKILKERGAKE